MSLVFQTDNGRSQMITVRRIAQNTAAEMLYFVSYFAQVRQISAEQLVTASEESIFGVKRFGDHYACVHAAFLEDLDSSEIDKAFVMIASDADTTEKLLGLGDAY